MSALLDDAPLVLEDLDVAVPCDGKLLGDPCDQPAAWIYRWTCGCVTLLCQLHHEKAQQLIASEPRLAFYCDDVHFKVMNVGSVEPLKGVSL